MPRPTDLVATVAVGTPPEQVRELLGAPVAIARKDREAAKAMMERAAARYRVELTLTRLDTGERLRLDATTLLADTRVKEGADAATSVAPLRPWLAELVTAIEALRDVCRLTLRVTRTTATLTSELVAEWRDGGRPGVELVLPTDHESSWPDAGRISPAVREHFVKAKGAAVALANAVSGIETHQEILLVVR